jgi:hypothetical protein
MEQTEQPLLFDLSPKEYLAQMRRKALAEYWRKRHEREKEQDRRDFIRRCNAACRCLERSME